MKNLLHWIALAALAVAVLTGCARLSPRANAFASLETTQVAVHNAMNFYGAEQRAGRVPAATTASIRTAHARYALAFDAALVVAQFNVQAATPDSVKNLALEVLTLIQQLR